MFRFRQAFSPKFSNVIYQVSDFVLDNGVVERRKVDVSTIVLPDAENYDLDVLLKAGVNLQQVNCKVIHANSASIVFDDDDKKDVEPATTKEN